MLHLVLACTGMPLPEVASWDMPAPSVEPATTVDVTTVVSATWAVGLSGLLDLDHPTAQAAGIQDERRDIVMTVHVVRHPSGRTWIVDTGVAVVEGEHQGLRGLVKRVVQPTPVESLDELLGSRDLSLEGVALTHVHLDHIMGLPQGPRAPPCSSGPAKRTRSRRSTPCSVAPTARCSRVIPGSRRSSTTQPPWARWSAPGTSSATAASGCCTCRATPPAASPSSPTPTRAPC